MLNGTASFIRYDFGNSVHIAHDEKRTYSNLLKEIYQKIKEASNTETKVLRKNVFERDIQSWIEHNFKITSYSDLDIIHFSFKNAHLTAENKLEFDVYVRANHNGVIFAATELLLAYSNEAFGSNAVSNSRISVTKETVIQNDVYTSQLTDEEAQVVKLIVTSSVEISDLYQLSIAPEKFCHISIDIQNIYDLANISFDASAMENQSLFYDSEAG